MKSVALLVGVTACCAQDLFLSPAQTTVDFPPHPAKKNWQPLTDLLSKWELTTDYAISVGNANGPLFVYEGGKIKMDTMIPTGSTSKWPSAMMFAGVVDDGTISSLDDPVSKYVPWWTKDPSDNRSYVTMRHLLSFTSGFGDGSPGDEPNTRAARQWREANGRQRNQASLHERLVHEIGAAAADPCNTTTGEVAACARSIYENVKMMGRPGTVYSYNSNHLSLAAGVAMHASGLGWQEIFEKYLRKPFNMSKSFYYGKCPDFAGSLITTGADYEQFLYHILTRKGVSQKMIEESEKDYTPFMTYYPTLYGNYAFGHFLMCFDSIDGMTQQCQDAKCHMDPGAFGFIPIVDRKLDYYVQLVAAETSPTGSYPLSGIPEYLAVAIKPVVDAIIRGDPGTDAHTGSYGLGGHYPGFLSMSVADINYCVDCKLHPEHCD